MHYQNKSTSCDIVVKLTCFVVNILFAEDKLQEADFVKTKFQMN